jgi:hypothetical protein
MKGIICGIILVIFSNGHAQPRLKVNDWKQGFGEVKQGEPVTLDYVVTNSGTQPLVFERYEVSCSCTSATLPAAPVAPGATVNIPVSFKTEAAIGLQDRVVKVYSNDLHSPAKLRFRGTVREKK